MLNKTKIGCDLVYIPRLRQKILKRGSSFVQKIFSEAELAGNIANYESLAGKLAAKEALIKTLPEETKYQLNQIQVLKESNGAPYIIFNGLNVTNISISHDGDYAMAVVFNDLPNA